MPKPYALSNWRWRSQAPHRARNASRSTTGSRRAGLGKRLPPLEPVAAADADLAPGIVVARPRAGAASPAGPSDTSGRVRRRPLIEREGYSLTRDPVPTNGERPADDRLVWLDLEMTGLDVERHVIVEIAALVTDDDLEPLDDGIDLIVHQPPSALAEMDDFVRTMHTKSALLPAIEASTLDARRRRRPGRSTTCADTCPSPAPRRCAATRSASTAASSTTSYPSSTSTCTTAASTCRASRSCAGAGIPPLQEAPRQERDAPRARRRARVDRRAAVLPRARCCSPHRHRRAVSPSSVAQTLPSSVVTERSRAEWPMRPMRHALPGELAEAAAHLDAVGGRAAPCAASASSAPSGSHAVVSSGRR